MAAVADSDGLQLLWKLQVLSGAGALVIGLIAMVWPLETAAAVVILWGFFVLIDGVGLAVLGSGSRGRGRGWVLLAAGVTALVALFAIFRPGVAAATAIWVVGIWLVARAAAEAVEAFRYSGGSARWLRLIGAAFTLALGVLFLWNPGGSVVALAFLLGLLAALRGAALIVAGLRTRQLVRAATSGALL